MCKIYVSCNEKYKGFRRENGETKRFPRKMAKIPKNILGKIQIYPMSLHRFEFVH